MIKGELPEEGDAPRAFVRPAVRTTIDEISKRAIEMLQVDGRRSYASIARELRVDEAAVRQRVDTLVESRVVQFTTVSNPMLLGFTRQAMLGIRVDKGLDEAVGEHLAKIPEVAYVVLTAGGFELMAEVVGRSDAHLAHVVATAVEQAPGVVSVETFPYDSVEKETYSWGVL